MTIANRQTLLALVALAALIVAVVAPIPRHSPDLLHVQQISAEEQRAGEKRLFDDRADAMDPDEAYALLGKLSQSYGQRKTHGTRKVMAIQRVIETARRLCSERSLASLDALIKNNENVPNLSAMLQRRKERTIEICQERKNRG